jgi:hypothetical protein
VSDATFSPSGTATVIFYDCTALGSSSSVVTTVRE